MHRRSLDAARAKNPSTARAHRNKFQDDVVAAFPRFCAKEGSLIRKYVIIQIRLKCQTPVNINFNRAVAADREWRRLASLFSPEHPPNINKLPGGQLRPPFGQIHIIAAILQTAEAAPRMNPIDRGFRRMRADVAVSYGSQHPLRLPCDMSGDRIMHRKISLHSLLPLDIKWNCTSASGGAAACQTAARLSPYSRWKRSRPVHRHR
ncbi:hypothetical protein D3C77_378780 [compost metagenome]